MAIKPILFNTEMVRAILDGRKTCTRRIVKDGIPDDAMWGYTAFTPKGYISCRGVYADGYGEGFFKLPYQPGDILYVRETWGHPISLNSDKQYVFRADKIAESGFKMIAIYGTHPSTCRKSSENLVECYERKSGAVTGYDRR